MKKVLMLVMVLCLGLCVGAAWAQQTPFLGEPQKLPGRILWQHYDQGLLNESWYDTNTVHDGSTVWRQDTMVGGGEDNIGWVNDGEWVEFTVDATPGVYDLTIATCMPNGQTGRSVAFTWEDAVDPNFITIACPETGGWAQSNIVLTTINDVEITVSGTQTLRTTFLGGSCNYWWFQLTEKYVPLVVSPAYGAVDMPVGTNTLQWESNAVYPPPAGFEGYNVYFSNVLMDVVKRVALLSPGPGTGTSIDVTTAPATRYYWSVDTRVADVNDAVGDIWYFDTYSDLPQIAGPVSANIYEGCSGVLFEVVVTAKNPADIALQWYDGAGALGGQTGTSYTTGVAGSYYCIASNTVTGETTTSATAILTTYPVDLMANLEHHNISNPSDSDAATGRLLQSSSVSGDTINMVASGDDLWGGTDEGRLVAAQVIGDNVEIIAKVTLLGGADWNPATPGSGEQWIKAGVTIRNNLTHNSQNLSMYVTSGNGKDFQGRRTDGGSQSLGAQTGEDYYGPVWLRLVRQGNTITGYWSDDGENWILAPEDFAGGDPIYNPMTFPVDFQDPVYVGVVGTNHGSPAATSIRFDDVQIRAYRAANPSPADGATGVDYSAPITLSWDPDRKAPCPAEYDVYVSADPNVRSVAPVHVSDTTLPITAGPNQKIYWAVDTVVGNGQGSMWSFETATPITGPEDVTALAGSNIQLAVEIDTYNSLQWYGPAGMLTGETGKTLSLTNVGAADEGAYYCIANTASGDVQSRTATLDAIFLIAHYEFEGDITDSSGYGHDGTFGPKILPTDPNVQYAEGVIGNAIGVNTDAEYAQYVVFGSVGISGDMPRTISCWAKAAVDNNLITGWCNIFGFTSLTSGNNKSFDFNRRGSAPYGYCIHAYGWEADIAAVDDQWHFLTASYDGTAIRWYHNGSFIGQVNRALTTEDLLHLGKRAHSDPLWRGWVDDARVYDGALDAEAVAALYLATITDGKPCVATPAGDLNGDCVTDLKDFAIWAQGWGWCDLLPVNLCD